MLLGNTVEFAHMTFRPVPKVLYAVDVIFLVCKKLGVVDAEMLKVRYIQHVVAAPTIRIDDAIRYEFPLNDRHQSCG